MATRNQASPVRFVELVRVSSRSQAERDTPEIQRAALDGLRRARPGVLVERIEEPGGLSGALPMDQRPDLLRLKELTEQKAYDEIRVYALDRLTRSEDPRERMAVYGMAMDAGARIVDTNGRAIDPADDSGMGEMDYFLNTWGAARERRAILKRTMDGRRRAAAAGRSANGNAPYGITWSKTSGKWELVDGQAEVVRRIFELCVDGWSTIRIADLLNAESLPSPRNRRWAHCTVRNIIRNRSYTGRHHQRLAGEEFVIEVPPVVEETAWERAQAALDSRQNMPRHEHVSHDALCRGLAICGRCGASMHIYSVQRGKYLYYRCSTRHHLTTGTPCGSPSHPVAKVDETVWRVIVDKIRNSDLISEAAEGGGPEGEDWMTVVDEATDKLSRLVGLEREALHLRSQDLLSSTALVERLQEIKRDRKILEERISVAQQAMAQRAALDAMQADVEERMAAIRTNLDAADFETRRSVLEALVPRLPGYGVTIHDDEQIQIVGALDIAAAPAGQGGASSPEGAGPAGGNNKAASAGGSGGGRALGKVGSGTGWITTTVTPPILSGRLPAPPAC